MASACVGPQTSGTNSFNIKPGMRDSGRAVFCLVLFLGSFSTRAIPCKNTVLFFTASVSVALHWDMHPLDSLLIAINVFCNTAV